MSDISIEQIKSLREKTGLSVAEVKKALAEAAGDESKALEILAARGGDVAAKKAGRELNAGVVDSYVHSDRRSGAIIELLCETDFVTKNEEFLSFAHGLAMHITAFQPANLDELMTQPFIHDSERTIREVLTALIAKIGENIQIGRFERLGI